MTSISVVAFVICEWVMAHIWMSHVTCMNESCHTCQFNVCRGIIIYHSSMNEWYHIWMSHICAYMNKTCHTDEFNFGHGRKESWHTDEFNFCRGICHPWMSHGTYEWDTAHIWMSSVTHMNESCHTYEWVMSHRWTNHVTQMNSISIAAYVIYECVMVHMNESCHTFESVMSTIWMWVVLHICMSHVTHTNASCHPYECVTSHIWVSQGTHPWRMNESKETWTSHVTNMNHYYWSCHKYERVIYRYRRHPPSNSATAQLHPPHHLPAT